MRCSAKARENFTPSKITLASIAFLFKIKLGLEVLELLVRRQHLVDIRLHHSLHLIHLRLHARKPVVNLGLEVLGLLVRRQHVVDILLHLLEPPGLIPHVICRTFAQQSLLIY